MPGRGLSNSRQVGGCDLRLQISTDRIRCLGATSRAEHLSAFADVDISLDPFPQNGGISTLEALYMGVPVVGKLGKAAGSRGAGSILSAGNVVLTTDSVNAKGGDSVAILREIGYDDTVIDDMVKSKATVDGRRLTDGERHRGIRPLEIDEMNGPIAPAKPLRNRAEARSW